MEERQTKKLKHKIIRHLLGWARASSNNKQSVVHETLSAGHGFNPPGKHGYYWVWIIIQN